MSGNLRFIDLYGALTEAIPELCPRIASEFGKNYDLPDEIPGEYPIFEDVVKPFLRECLESKAHNQTSARMFQFFERMATSSDSAVVTLLRIGILESLAYDSVFYVLGAAYMGPKTAEYVELDRREYERRKILPTSIN